MITPLGHLVDLLGIVVKIGDVIDGKYRLIKLMGEGDKGKVKMLWGNTALKAAFTGK